MDEVQLSEDYGATMRRQFSFLFTGFPGTHFIDFERVKG